MNRFVRNKDPNWADYAASALFAIIFLAASAIVVSPGTFVGNTHNPAIIHSKP
jgi:hypothetical protein